MIVNELRPVVRVDPAQPEGQDLPDLLQGRLDAAFAALGTPDPADSNAAAVLAADGSTTATPMLVFGHLRRRFLAQSQPENHADGKVDNISTYEWNECDKVAKYETDQGADGTVDYSGSYSWDDQAMVMTERYTSKTTTVTRYKYENGVLLREETDDGGDGSIDSMLVHIYGSECLLP